jgi:hypothetical protein
MPDFLLLMHNDAPGERSEDWPAYLSTLESSGHLRGGSAIGDGVCVRKDGRTVAIAAHLNGFVRVEASGMDEAKRLVAGNPVFEAGGTVEIRTLPVTD